MGTGDDGCRARAVADGPYALSIEEHQHRETAGDLEDCAEYQRALLQPVTACWDSLVDLANGALVGISEHEGDLIRICRALLDLKATIDSLDPPGGDARP
jgi:hypothetical protein